MKRVTKYVITTLLIVLLAIVIVLVESQVLTVKTVFGKIVYNTVLIIVVPAILSYISGIVASENYANKERQKCNKYTETERVELHKSLEYLINSFEAIFLDPATNSYLDLKMSEVTTKFYKKPDGGGAKFDTFTNLLLPLYQRTTELINNPFITEKYKKCVLEIKEILLLFDYKIKICRNETPRTQYDLNGVKITVEHISEDTRGIVDTQFLPCIEHIRTVKDNLL